MDRLRSRPEGSTAVPHSPYPQLLDCWVIDGVMSGPDFPNGVIDLLNPPQVSNRRGWLLLLGGLTTNARDSGSCAPIACQTSSGTCPVKSVNRSVSLGGALYGRGRKKFGYGASERNNRRILFVE